MDMADPILLIGTGRRGPATASQPSQIGRSPAWRPWRFDRHRGPLYGLCVAALLTFACLMPSLARADDDPLPSSIGTAKMLPDRTIVLDLVATGPGITGIGELKYRIGGPGYDEVLAHLGGLAPGEVKSVPPWPSQ